MKKRNKILSVVLASFVLFGSIPFFMTNADAAYFTDGTKWERTNSDYGKIKATLTNTDYKFMQTEDNQKFTFNQHLSLEKAAGEAYAHFNSLTLHTGGTNTDSSLKVEEYPEKITTNGTKELLDKMSFSYAWSATNGNASDVGVSGKDIRSHDLRGTVVDLSGCPDYQWDCALSFNVVHPENESYGEIRTNYYWDFNWTYADVGVMGSRTTRQVRFKTDIIITDVRELINKVNEFKTQIKDYENGNSQGLTEARYTKLKKFVNAVSTDMLDGSKFYTQADVDAMYAYITETATGLADYSDYYQIRSKISKITEKSGDSYIYGNGYTKESLDVVSSELSKIDSALNKSLLLAQQDVVDEATTNLKGLLSKLIAKSVYQADTSGSKADDVFDTCVDGPDAEMDKQDGTEMNFHLNATKYKFIQIYDDEIFNVHQEIYASSRHNTFGRTFPYVEAFTFDETTCTTDCFYKVDGAVNNTTAFLSKVLPGSLSDHENGSKEFNQWKYVARDKLYDGSSGESARPMTSDGLIKRIEIGGSGAEGLGSRYGYWADADILFKGDGAGVASAEENLSFMWRLQTNDDDTSSETFHLHLPVSVLVTDARDLVKLYDELKELEGDEEERLKYTEASVNALTPVLDVIPTDLVYGGKYYTQTEVDSYYNQLLGVKNDLELVADYTEYQKAYEEALAVNNDDAKYEPTAFSAHFATIEYIDSNLDKRLGVTQQNVVDESTKQLKDLLIILEQNAYCDYTELDNLISIAEEKFPKDNSEGKFREDIYNAMMEALTSAKAVEREMVKGPDGVNQKAIDTAAEELLYAIYYEYYDSLAQDIINTNNQNGDEKIYLDEEYEKFKNEYKDIIDKLEIDVKDDTITNHDAFEEATTGLSNAHTSLEEAKFVDLTDVKNAIEEGKNVTNDGYTNSSWNNLQDKIKDAEDLVATNPVQGENGTGTREVEKAEEAIREAIENLQKKADYTSLEKAMEDAEAILNDTETIYTNSSKKAVADAYNEAEKLDKDLPDSEQSTIDEIAENLSAAVIGIKVKADYSALNEAVEKAEEALGEDITYTSSTKQALENALNNAKNVNDDLSVDDQAEIDGIVTSLTEATENLTEAADIKAYEDVMKEAEEIISEGNSEGRYDDDVWNEFVDSVTEAKDTVGDNFDDIPKTEQENVNNATDNVTKELINVKNNRHIIVKFQSDSGELVKSYRIKEVEASTFGELSDIPVIPEDVEWKKYTGWHYADETIMSLTDEITTDITLHYAGEEIKFVAKADSGAVIDNEDDFFEGFVYGTTVEALLNSLENNSELIVVKDKDGNIVEKSDVIATGMTLELISKRDASIKKDTVTVVVKGDVNGDGLVNDDDFNKSIDMCLKNTSYSETEKAYFDANDVDGDGVLDGLDLFYISNMRYGN
jgi:hypothetical protein